MATQQAKTVTEYLRTVSEADPKTALEIAMAETQRVQAEAESAREEYRTMSEIEFDSEGRIAKCNMGGLWRLARIYSESNVVPEHFRKSPSNCFIACQLAYRMRVDPFAVMQSLYIVPGSGKPSMEARLAIACLNASGQTVGRIRWRFDGEGSARSCTAFVVDRETGDELDLRIDWSTVEGEGWLSKKGSKWQTMPDQMFRYRSATWLIRAYYPEVMMGLRTTDEVEDIGPEKPAPGTGKARTLDDVAQYLASAIKPLGTVSYVGPMPSDEELAKEEAKEEAAKQPEPKQETAEIEAFCGSIHRKYSRCKTQTELNATVDKLLEQNPEDQERVKWITQLASEREIQIEKEG